MVTRRVGSYEAVTPNFDLSVGASANMPVLELMTWRWRIVSLSPGNAVMKQHVDTVEQLLKLLQEKMPCKGDRRCF